MSHTFRRDCYMCHGVCQITDEAIAARSRLNAAAPELLELAKELYMYLQLKEASVDVIKSIPVELSKRTLDILSRVEGTDVAPQ